MSRSAAWRSLMQLRCAPSPYVFHVSHPIALYPPPPNLHYRMVRVSSGGGGIAHKPAFGGYRAKGANRKDGIANRGFGRPLKSTKIRVFRVLFWAPFLPPCFPHFPPSLSPSGLVRSPTTSPLFIFPFIPFLTPGKPQFRYPSDFGTL